MFYSNMGRALLTFLVKGKEMNMNIFIIKVIGFSSYSVIVLHSFAVDYLQF
jgi:hypothetical protein